MIRLLAISRARGARSFLLTAAACSALAGCASRSPLLPEAQPTKPLGTPRHTPTPPAVGVVAASDSARLDPDALRVLESDRGEATYYASFFDGRRTASGVVFRNSEYFAAHRTYPFGTLVRVTNLLNDRSVIVRVVDRGPNGTSARIRATIIDLSQRAASDLDFIRRGRVPVRVDVLEWGS